MIMLCSKTHAYTRQLFSFFCFSSFESSRERELLLCVQGWVCGWVSFCQSFCLYLCACLSVSGSLGRCLTFSLCVYGFASPSLSWPLFVCMADCVGMAVYFSVDERFFCLYVCVCVFVFVCLSLSFCHCLSVCLSVCLSSSP